MKPTVLTFATTALITAGLSTNALTIASEDFDGGALNLTSSSVPTLDGGGGDTHAVGATQAWPTTGGTPFSIADNSTGDVGDTTAFAGDTEGIFGVNSDFTNNFLGISDSDEFGTVTSTWTFDISGATNALTLSIDMGSMEGSTFGYGSDTLFTFSYAIDGGSSTNAFTIAPGGSYTYRLLDDGSSQTEDTALLVSGDGTVIKTLADTGLTAANTYLDKTPASGAGAGQLDTFSTSIVGSGNELVLTLNAFIPFEAAAFDNIAITEVPEPSSLALLGLGGLLVARRRRG